MAMRRFAVDSTIFLLVVVASQLLALASGECLELSKQERYKGSFSRRILQRNGTNTDVDPAKFTGTLALYSLFGLFVLASISTCFIGIMVSLQWPNPRVCCYRTPYSDIPSSESCGCCALHRLNIGFAVTWMALLVLLVLALIVYLMAAAAVLALIHAVIAYRLVRQLKMSYGTRPQLEMAMALEGAVPAELAAGLTVTGMAVDRPLPGVPVPGIPVVSVPMSVAVVEAQLQTHLNYANDNVNGINSRGTKLRRGNRRRSSSGSDGRGGDADRGTVEGCQLALGTAGGGAAAGGHDVAAATANPAAAAAAGAGAAEVQRPERARADDAGGRGRPANARLGSSVWDPSPSTSRTSAGPVAEAVSGSRQYDSAAASGQGQCSSNTFASATAVEISASSYNGHQCQRQAEAPTARAGQARDAASSGPRGESGRGAGGPPGSRWPPRHAAPGGAGRSFTSPNAMQLGTVAPAELGRSGMWVEFASTRQRGPPTLGAPPDSPRRAVQPQPPQKHLS